MYRQIRVDPRDTCYQQILWRSNKSEDVQCFKLQTVTYGTASAPYLALRVLKQLSHDDGHEYPRAVSILKNQIYVDDVLFGENDPELLRKSRNELITLLNRGGFELRKWASNSSELLSDIDSDNSGLACHKILQTDEKLKILGIGWNPIADTFQFKVSLEAEPPRSKRLILAAIARLFDPLGWVTPATVTAKVFMQLLWRLKLDWDAEIPIEHFQTWQRIYSKFTALNEIQIPRWTHQGPHIVQQEMHGFADASSVAYAAVLKIPQTALLAVSLAKTW
ncbi:PREDICTED: uncharacterized protein LOC107191236 [Dufourea novaeangliae]|uniref:uncharacterized protein LOC107191236 n=1 Tax=Dufourea novaeangliae TaxID=178035 RepID=UPI000767A61B|nr:PREDICTED: uncharacterized protein LOC107191236 [Dufourea novaeangliae]